MFFVGQRKERRSKEKQGEVRRRRKAEARRQKKAKEQARGSKPKPQVLPPQYFYFGWVHALCPALNYVRPAFTCQGTEERR